MQLQGSEPLAEATAHRSEPMEEQTPSKSATTPSDPEPVENTLHCVKCHKSYTPSRNGPTSCQIAHDEENQVDTHENGGYRHTLPCCRLDIWDEYEDGPVFEWRPEMCYIGPHTTVHQYDWRGWRIVYSGAEGGGDCCGK
ncbi:hypothetical protein B0H12DRAFT_1159025 [Mycena haematopus]|nr:hypothetical protein B0H12DRAFT_1159025 [Mycena haematopus]